MTTEMPHLHPLIPPGPFDLATLLEFEPPTRWRPEPEEKVLGELVRIAEKTSFGRAAPTLYLLVPPDERDDPSARYLTVRASGVVLRGALDELKPRDGERLAVKFEGMRTSAAGHQYAMYRMAVHRAGRWVMAS
jgi:hypothetical protein